jgi:hypothetical protein
MTSVPIESANEGLKSLLSRAHRGWVEVIKICEDAHSCGSLNPICRFPAPVASLPDDYSKRPGFCTRSGARSRLQHLILNRPGAE